jgi:hypothetical protein
VPPPRCGERLQPGDHATLQGLQYALDHPEEAVNDFMSAFPKARDAMLQADRQAW